MCCKGCFKEPINSVRIFYNTSRVMLQSNMAVSRMACSTINSSLSSRLRGAGGSVQLFNSCLSSHSCSLHWHTTQTLVGAVSSLVISVPTGCPVVTANVWTQPCVPLIPRWLYWRLLRGWYLWRDRPPSNHAHLTSCNASLSLGRQDAHGRCYRGWFAWREKYRKCVIARVCVTMMTRKGAGWQRMIDSVSG